jgi:hypothetical protein
VNQPVDFDFYQPTENDFGSESYVDQSAPGHFDSNGLDHGAEHFDFGYDEPNAYSSDDAAINTLP